MSKPTMTEIEGLAREALKAREDAAAARLAMQEAARKSREADRNLSAAMKELTK